ncbi:hypothetical protein J2X20_004879 [Pelomonas saccharophila]|uniref:DUF4124 domain-containing protein n=1 Tax=Roseateles saccharophilus TaxID=304 RepID=A0ABU1YTM8_ROSSA|nr:hypothetical protein [Roseateles saccharophilus]MDR7272205.1 hypothetical protein [Roseateles saccharophilus]
MKRLKWWAVLAVVLGMSNAGAQQVWKCEVNGKVNFSDKPCPQAGQPVAERSLQPNVVEAMKPEIVNAAMGRPPAASAPPQSVGNACPGDGEIRGMETRANSTTLGEAERQFLQDEVRRVRQCRAGQGRYREADWVISREAQAAQTQISDRARYDARLRAEAMHSAADPDEGDRIARRRIAEEKMQRRQQQQLQRMHPASYPAS